MKNKERYIYVVHLKNNGDTVVCKSIASICRRVSKRDLGITLNALYNCRLQTTGYYENKVCKIEKQKLQ